VCPTLALGPRFAMWLFGDRGDAAFGSALWPLLGLFLAPSPFVRSDPLGAAGAWRAPARDWRAGRLARTIAVASITEGRETNA
jgi:hypothetical protein